jgi:hypothetical protein
MFRALPPAIFGETDDESLANLQQLAGKMVAPFKPPKDGRDDEESGIPALYTYLGQFIDHDITFDPASSLQKQNDPAALTDYRTPAFDLDNIYGRGPADQPYMYKENGREFLLGNMLHGGSAGAQDLPRNNSDPRRAFIGDPRNDENTNISQLQGLFLRFHNRTQAENPGLSFEAIQQLVRFHYQYIIVHDFLPRIVVSDVLNELKVGGHYSRDKLKFFQWKNEPFMPVEFSGAAYRFGHSMVRPGYRLNDAVPPLPILPVPNSPDSLVGFRVMNPAWGIDWGRFIDIDVRNYNGTAPVNQRRLQFAYRIDTSLVNPLSKLPGTVASPPPASLPERNLVRGLRLDLPSGQAVARAMGIDPLPDDKILIGKAVDNPDPAPPSIADLARTFRTDVFRENCPLWTYILAEAMHYKEDVPIPVVEKLTIKTPKLGPVGGRIVAEVFLGLLFGDPSSLLSLDPRWTPPTGLGYTLKNFVQYALGN